MGLNLAPDFQVTLDPELLQKLSKNKEIIVNKSTKK